MKGRGELGGAYIVRLPCGPPQQYVRKELLWPYVREFADRGIAHANATLAAMAESGRRCELYAVHGGLGWSGPGAGEGWVGGGRCSAHTAVKTEPWITLLTPISPFRLLRFHLAGRRALCGCGRGGCADEQLAGCAHGDDGAQPGAQQAGAPAGVR